jgi:hypothetical protein
LHHKLELSPQLTKVSFNNEEIEESYGGGATALNTVTAGGAPTNRVISGKASINSKLQGKLIIE